MRKDREKTIKRLKNRSIVSPIIFFIFSMIGSLLAISIIIMALFAIVLENKFDTSVFSTNKFVKQIDEQKTAGKNYDEILSEISDAQKRPLAICITDQKEQVKAYYGDKIDIQSDSIIDVNRDSALHISLAGGKPEYVKDANEFTINIQEIVTEIAADGRKIESFSDAGDILERVIYSRDYWVESMLSDKSKVYIKYEIELIAKDIFELMALAVVLAIIFTISCIGQLINAVTNIVSKRYYLHLLLSDPVTGGDNEFAFENYAFKYITSIFNRKKGFAIVDLSIVKYQNYCTLYGTEEGERLLRGMEKIIKRNLSGNELIARISNGDFMMLVNTDKKVTDEKALTIRVRNMIDNLPTKLSESVKGDNALQGMSNVRLVAGFYYLPPVTNEDSGNRRRKSELNIKNLCIKAGMAKSALREEKGMMVYNHEMWEKEIWEQKVENMMQDALNNEEFKVYIQPKYNPSTNELKGGEALVRWISPTEGFISPGQFIPIFERTGFVTKLDDYMILHTAKLQADWLAAGKKIVPISVNVSRAHFAQPDLAEHIRDLVDTYPVPHEFIEIELTESAFFDDKNALLTTVHRLQEYGFEVSMDDFGSGYSSLNSLKDLPLDVLKLDAEFFRGEDFGGRGEIVVSKAIALAKQLNMKIVAEGVEKKEQVDFLASQDCDMIQGYYFAKPMPADEYEQRMS